MDSLSPSLRLLTTEEVAVYLHVSRATVYRMVDARRIPFLRVGGALRFSREQIDAWLMSRPAREASALL